MKNSEVFKKLGASLDVPYNFKELYDEYGILII